MVKDRILELSEEKGREPNRKEVIDWFKENPNPEDSQVHAWAEEMGISPHKLETLIYKLVSEYSQKM